MNYSNYIKSLIESDDFIITDEMIERVRKFESFDSFMRAGGFSTETLDRAAFGFAEEDIKELDPSQLRVKWKDDLDQVKSEIDKAGSPRNYAEKVNLETPIDVVFEKGKFFVDDGHHRYMAAKILKKPLKVNLTINDQPGKKLFKGLGYDEYNRQVFDLIKRKLHK